MKNKILIIVAVLVVAFGFLATTGMIVGIENTENLSASTARAKIKIYDPVFLKQTTCLRDSNNDGIIKISDGREFFATSFKDCKDGGGSPGKITTLEKENFFIPLPKFLNGLKIKNPAAIYYTTGSKSQSATSQTRSQSTSSSSQPTSSSSQSTSTNNTNPSIPVVGVLSPNDLSVIAEDRIRAGIDKKEFDWANYQCADFARDLEASDPRKYTVTDIVCTVKVTCISNGRKEIFYKNYGHLINDVHSSSGNMGYVEPQSGKEVDITDLSSLTSAQAFDVPSCDSEHAESIEVKHVACMVNSYKSMIDAYNKIGKENFRPGFEPVNNTFQGKSLKP